MRIVVPVKYVPDATGDRGFDTDYNTLRDGGRLSELDEYAVEQAIRIVEAGTPAEIVFLTMGPKGAVEALRKSLAMGGDKAVHIVDDSLAGTDAMGTSAVLAAAIRRLGADLVVCGIASTDGTMSVIPAMLAEYLGWPQMTLASELTVTDDKVTIRRDLDTATERVESAIPALVSVTDFTGEARYPSFKGIMAAKKKPMEMWSLADLDIDPESIGTAGSWTMVQDITKRPLRQTGIIVKDEGDAGIKAAEFLSSQKFI